jgi:molybdate transport system substrate-binding protein
MTKRKWFFAFFVLVIPVMFFAEDAQTLFAWVGTGIKEPVAEIAAMYEKKTGVTVVMTFGNFGTLLGQLQLDPKGDILMPGSMASIESARKKGLVSVVSAPIAYHVPVIVTPKGNPAHIKTVEDLAKPGVKLILPDKVSTALGVMAYQIFEKRGITAAADANILAFMESPQKVVAAILLGQGDAGIIEASNGAKNAGKLEIIPIDPAINVTEKLTCVVLSCTKNQSLADDFLRFAESEGPAVFAKYGYHTAP